MFKLGDRVQFVDIAGNSQLYQRLGFVATVSRAGPDYFRVEEFDGSFRNARAVRMLGTPCEDVAGNAQRELTAPAARKDDSGKLDMTLLDDMPRALKAVVEVMQWANIEKKPVPYERGSWVGVGADRYRAAVKRHDRDACDQAIGSLVPARKQRDPETNKLHLAHIATSALMALEQVLREEAQ